MMKERIELYLSSYLLFIKQVCGLFYLMQKHYNYFNLMLNNVILIQLDL